ncbi:MAG TPA: phage head-tail connector protein [Rhizomicrobium sp.]|nr:phage head-tail connector protein [Rhizomicrobium sp.]
MSLQLNTPPAAEPVTLDQAKAWLRVESGADEDALIAALIPAARARAEWHTGRAFVTQAWTLWLDRSDGVIEVPLPPLQSVASVTLYAPDGTPTVLDSGAYLVAGQRVILAQPPLLLRQANGIAVAFTAGYGGAEDVPAPIASAILQIVASLYDHRGNDVTPTPDAALALLAPYRTIKF